MLTQVEQNQWLLKADVLRIFSTCFTYPDADKIHAVQQLTQELHHSHINHPVIAPLLQFFITLLNQQQLAEEYSRLFIQGGIPLSETAYHPSIDTYSELSAYYEAFGVQPISGDAPDTLSYELEFLAVLCLKVALASNKDQQTVAHQAYAQFIHYHLLPLVEKLHQKLENTFAESLYTQLTDFLKKFLQQENQTFNMN